MTTHKKAAATSMIKRFKNDVEVIRIDREILPMVKREIDTRLDWLRTNKLITSTKPCYSLGSTRLIADKLGGFISPHQPYESMASYKRACDVKTSFGDIDIDVEMIASRDDIIEALETRYPGAETHCVKCGDKEINSAVEITPGKVVQLDLLDVTNYRKELEYQQFSSFLDLGHNLKGLVRDLLVNIVTKHTIISDDINNDVQAVIKQTPLYIDNCCKVKTGEQVVFKNLRWSFGHTEFKMLAQFNKINKAGKHIKTVYKIKVADIFMCDELNEEYHSNIFEPVHNYTDLDMIAKLISLTSGEVLYHSILMLKEIKQFSNEQRQVIWENLVSGINGKCPKGAAGGQISQLEADVTINYLQQYFPGAYNVSEEDG